MLLFQLQNGVVMLDIMFMSQWDNMYFKCGGTLLFDIEFFVTCF